ncbi:CinA family protein [Agromyces sp. MMS24-JH15]|uniref:CinA family protein n=1 Tax=Agromyces sp. MMS24-JH15 TaxID=3243765 RepID=UPI003747EC45
MSDAQAPASPADEPSPDAVALIEGLRGRRLTVAVAESLTGGLLASGIVDVPGASVAFLGGIVTYATELKRDLVGVDEELLEFRGPVARAVAEQMADRVRVACATDGRPADVGIATTGVAGPEWQGGRPPGTVFVGIATALGVSSVALAFEGSRAEVRRAAVAAALRLGREAVESLPPPAEYGS